MIKKYLHNFLLSLTLLSFLIVIVITSIYFKKNENIYKIGNLDVGIIINVISQFIFISVLSVNKYIYNYINYTSPILVLFVPSIINSGILLNISTTNYNLYINNYNFQYYFFIMIYIVNFIGIIMIFFMKLLSIYINKNRIEYNLNTYTESDPLLLNDVFID